MLDCNTSSSLFYKYLVPVCGLSLVLTSANNFCFSHDSLLSQEE